MTERFAARDAERPRSKQRGILESAKLAHDDHEDVLEQIVGVGPTGNAGQVAAQGRLDAPEQRLERIAVAAAVKEFERLHYSQ
jgi:hypothetical protein